MANGSDDGDPGAVNPQAAPHRQPTPDDQPAPQQLTWHPQSAQPPVPGPVPLRTPHRRRDRHGRGIRGPLIPVSLPGSRTRGDTFDEYVLEGAARLRARLPEQVEHVQFSVEDIPPPAVTDALADGEGVPLGSGIPADSDHPARVVVYRRTVELRAGAGAEAAELVYDVLLEQIAELLGILPEDIDPEYGEEAG